MSWQDIREHYEGRDEEPEPTDVEVITEPCPVCGDPYTHPADECDPCCSERCAGVMYADRQAAVNVALAAWWERESKTARTVYCLRCGLPFEALPTTAGYCSFVCQESAVASDPDEIPY